MHILIKGADMVEIGNYDSFYGQGVSFSAEDIIRMATETRKLLPATPLSVTIPHNIPLNEQIILAKKLESIGISSFTWLMMLFSLRPCRC